MEVNVKQGAEVCVIQETKEKPIYCCTMEEFGKHVSEQMKQISPKEYAIVSLDFDNFNFINDLFGYHIGDKTLCRMESYFCGCLREGELVSRLHADHFIFWIKMDNDRTVAQRFDEMTDVQKNFEDLLPEHYRFVCSGGIVILQDLSLGLSALLDRANFARKNAKGNHSNTFLYFDEKMQEDLRWKKIITFAMEAGLAENEFLMYLQPKVLIQTGQVAGAEALVRWKSKEFGMIFPDRFIPVLEQNGFVKQIDFFMLEQACLFLRQIIEGGEPAFPISVNFSKLHIRTPGFVHKVFHTVNRYGLPTTLIEIEFTESVFSDDFQALLTISSELKYLGFKVALDDFGRAYSSLNYLKDLPLDVIKIDKEFLNASADTDRGRMIIAKVVEMIKSLRMVSVMEGVETEEQVEFLQKLSCDLGQGYFYAKPMPVEQFRAYMKQCALLPKIDAPAKEKQDETQEKSYLTGIPQEFQMDSWELYTLGKNIDMGLMKGYMDQEATVQYINDRALEYLGYSRQEFREKLHNGILSFLHPDDVAAVKENAEQLIKTGKPVKLNTRAIRRDGKIIVLQGSCSCVIDSEGRPIGIYAFQDVTEELERTEKLNNQLEEKIIRLQEAVWAEQKSREALRISEERYRLVVEHSDHIMFDWDFINDRIFFSNKFERIFHDTAVQDQVSTNPKVRERIHPDDLQVFEQWVERTFRQPGSNTAQYRMLRKDGDYLWMSIQSTAVCNQEGLPVRAVGIFSNINQQKKQIDRLTLKARLDPLTRLYNKGEIRVEIEALLAAQPGRTAAFFIVDVDNFKGINDRLGHQFGDSVLKEAAQKIKSLFREDDLIGRLGGDEIAVFLRDCESEEAARKRALDLVVALRKTYFGEHTKYSVSASVGIALYPQHGKNFEELYRYADIALYESKEKGKNCFTVYRDEMSNSLLESQATVENTDRFLNAYFSGDPIFNTFNLLYESKDVSATIRQVLKQMGKRFGVDRVYIFEHTEDLLFTCNTFEWCAPGIQPEIENLRQLKLEEMRDYISRYSGEGILCCNNVRAMDPHTIKELEKQGIKSFLHCAIYSEGEMKGFVGFDSCKERVWRGDEIATLGYFTKILSVFLLQTHTKRELLNSYQNHVSMLDNLSGFVYVIDSETFEILYANQAIKNLNVSIGSKCYAEAYRRKTPCERCPAREISDDKPHASIDLYSMRLDCWINSTASRLNWAGRKNAVLICCTDITQYKSK